ncbi:tyrosine-type recombinase/integrase [Desulfohalobium retbaense]|uniref:Integrase family protein n=1 Tax=Desulfohalobium retbaense (strain ATCC 49708 / DSM 5692 / JCM 16813 / HR100) TaxID=485915 RepID=C8X397_DESRD|nr:integrase arm-type DNA-binding domain-containing protein [Desulfohalobium retbaense]ACV68894.1 integrase family protein [Desulfohalobium retbaense DSM 5692]
MALTVKAIQAAKPREKLYRLNDERGLYLEIPPKGAYRWRFRYRFHGKPKMVSLGRYPDISLKQAREKRDEMRALVASSIDPSNYLRQARHAAKDDSFEAVAREWHKKFKSRWTEGHAATVLTRLEQNAFPWIGSQPIDSVTPLDILPLLRRIEDRGAIELAHRVRGIISQVFRFAVANERASRDPASDLRDALTPRQENHFAAITNPSEIPALLGAISEYQGHFVTRCALRLASLVFVRPGELRKAEWDEIDLAHQEWRLPPAKTKLRKTHIIPLAHQACAIFNEIHPLTGTGRYVFPSARDKNKPMSENTINAALRQLGFSKEKMTAHGFRSMASTRLNELGWHPDAIERQLGHTEKNGVRAAYNHAEYLEERRKMMQAWADYLDKLTNKDLL